MYVIMCRTKIFNSGVTHRIWMIDLDFSVAALLFTPL